MTPVEFVDAVVESCRDGAVSACVEILERPPGRRPATRLVELSEWFKALPVRDREFVIAAMRQASGATLFGVLCVIDGVRVIEPSGEKSEFHLTAIRNGVESQISPSETFLHDLIRADL